MERTRIAALFGAAVVLVMAPVLAIVASGELAYHPEQAVALIVNDKPYEPPIEAAMEIEEEIEYQEAAEEYPEYVYYEPIYNGNTYWYESDDEDAELEAKEWIAFRESGGDYSSRNGVYIGRYQLNEMYLDGDYSEENQEAAAEAYIADRYGSWQAAQEHWREYGWY